MQTSQLSSSIRYCRMIFFVCLFCFKLKPPLRRSGILCMSRLEGVLIVADSIYSPFTLSGEARKHKHRRYRRLTLEGENKVMWQWGGGGGAVECKCRKAKETTEEEEKNKLEQTVTSPRPAGALSPHLSQTRIRRKWQTEAISTVCLLWRPAAARWEQHKP